jgi:hypothetical protein
MECAFSHLRKQFSHRINSCQRILINNLEDTEAIGQEIFAKKDVGDPELEEDVHTVEQLAEDVLVGIRLVLVIGTSELMQQNGLTLFSPSFPKYRLPQIGADVTHPMLFPALPKKMW